MARSKLLASVIVGAAVGAALSMLDRTTREKTIETTKRVTNTISYYAANREELQQLIQEKVEAAQTLYENATENVEMFAEKIEEVIGSPTTVQSVMSDTKSADSMLEKE
ncbi:MAG: YtxH domain-containing protein [Lysinibacillus sp.]